MMVEQTELVQECEVIEMQDIVLEAGANCCTIMQSVDE